MGLCSSQIDTSRRGFSFKAFDDPLDMRMGGGGLTAADLLNTLSEVELATSFMTLGGETNARSLALAEMIVKEREVSPFSTVGRFVKLVRGVRTGLVPKLLDPATLTFQALRMMVNDECRELRKGLHVRIDMSTNLLHIYYPSI